MTGLASTQYQAVVLTADGKLWSSNANTPDLWTRIADDAAAFGVSDSGICWVSTQGYINRYNGSYAFPDTWYDGTGYACPDANICGIAATPDRLMLRSTDGRLFVVVNGASSEVSIESPAVNLYAVGSALVIEHEDGSVFFVDGADHTPRSIAEY